MSILISLVKMLPIPVLLLGGWLGILRAPFIGVFFISVLIPAENFLKIGIGPLSYIWPLTMATISAWISRLMFIGFKVRIARKPTLLVTLWLVWGAASFFWAADAQSVIVRLIPFAGFVTLFVLFQDLVKEDRQLKVLLFGYFIASVCYAILSIRGAVLFDLKRIVLTEEQNPNVLARALGIGLLMSPYMFHQLKKVLWKSLTFIGIVLLVIAIILTGSRGAWLGLVGAFGVGWLLSRGRVIRLRTILVWGLLITICIFLLRSYGIISPFIMERISTLLSSEGIGTASGRWNIWAVGLELVKDNLLIGVGLNNFHVRFEDYIDASWLAESYGIYAGREPHNVFLSIQGELGLIGLVIFISFYWSVFKTLLRYRTDVRAITGILIFAFIFFSGMSAAIQFSKFFWLALSISTLIPLVIQNEQH